MPTNQLPQEILIKILLYLPLVSIQACKLVSKQWNNLITGDPRLEYPSFAPFLFGRSVYSVSTKITNPVKISSRCNPPLSVNGIPIEWKDDEHIFTQLLLSESSKGIACVVTRFGIPPLPTLHRRLLFYNLFTGVSYPPAELPDPKAWFLYGFGYDSFADDCKMVSVKEGSSLFWVYSLRNRAWESFEGFPYAKYLGGLDERPSCSFNGVLHWLVDRRDQKAPPKNRILTYDLHTCRFGEMLLPVIDCYDYGTKVAELGGRLCYCSHSYKGHLLTMWTMREYGVSESWTRFLSIDLTELSQGYSRDEIEPSRVLYKCQSGRKLLLFVCKHYGTLYWYDIDNDRLVTRIQKNAWEKTEKRMSRKRERQEFEGMQQHMWLDR